ncbi:MAG: lysostaphin resistance A-like protein [Candidatus Hodarchaeales archaeon]
MKICPFCNSQTPDLKYCVYCGSELKSVDSSHSSQEKADVTKFILAIFTIFLLSLNSTVQIFFSLILGIFLPSSVESSSDLLVFFNLIIVVISNIFITTGIIFWFKNKFHLPIFADKENFHIFNITILFIVSITFIEVIMLVSDLFFDLLKLNPAMTSPYDMFFENDMMIILFSLLALIIGPLFEEIIYRFMILSLINNQWNSLSKSIIISALIFTFSHTLIDILEASLRYILLHFIVIFILGLLLGYIFLNWGLKAAVIFHSLWNLYSLIIQFLSINYDQQVLDNISLILSLMAIFTIIFFLKGKWRLTIKQLKTFKMDIHEILFPVLNLLIVVVYQVLIPIIIYLIFGDVFLSFFVVFYSPSSLILTFILLNKDTSLISRVFSPGEKRRLP